MSSLSDSHIVHVPIQLNPEVKVELMKTYVSTQRVDKDEEATCLEHFTTLLQKLATPPSYSTLRINTLKYCPETALQTVNEALTKDYRKKKWEPPEIELHPRIADLILVTSRGPMIDLEKKEKEVIVDLFCGMAVLRGADVFAQGIMGCQAVLKKGDCVSVYADLSGKCLKGLSKSYDGEKIFVGNGVSHVNRDQLFCKEGINFSGIGIEMTEPLYEAPCLSDTLPDCVFAQNLPSVICGHVIDPKPGEVILDMCAAPGGKTTHIATLMGNKGRVIAFDKSEHKVRKIKHNCDRLGITCVEAIVCDASKSICNQAEISGHPPYPPQSFDRVLVDAPCSALGQRPSLKNKMSLKELKSFPIYQRKILTVGLELVKPGGVLVYSTCSLPLEENEGQVEWVLKNYSHYTLEEQKPFCGGPGFVGTSLSDEDLYKLQRFDPAVEMDSKTSTKKYDIDTIGFFIAKFRRQSDCRKQNIEFV